MWCHGSKRYVRVILPKMHVDYTQLQELNNGLLKMCDIRNFIILIKFILRKICLKKRYLSWYHISSIEILCISYFSLTILLCMGTFEVVLHVGICGAICTAEVMSLDDIGMILNSDEQLMLGYSPCFHLERFKKTIEICSCDSSPQVGFSVRYLLKKSHIHHCRAVHFCCFPQHFLQV
jgi:hypothetical protein